MAAKKERLPVVLDTNVVIASDSDLLEIPEAANRKFKFRILTPKAFLKIYFERFALS